MTGHAVLTPLLMVILMITGDFLAMSLTTDTVRPSATPNAWRIGQLTAAGIIMGACLLAYCTAVLAVGQYALRLDADQVRTLTFTAMGVWQPGDDSTPYGNAGISGAHAPATGFSRRPWPTCSSLRALAIAGVAMTPLPPLIVAGTLVTAAALALVLDLVKRPVFTRLELS